MKRTIVLLALAALVLATLAPSVWASKNDPGRPQPRVQMGDDLGIGDPFARSGDDMGNVDPHRSIAVGQPFLVRVFFDWLIAQTFGGFFR